jgi:iron complex outermembrane receptor protein
MRGIGSLDVVVGGDRRNEKFFSSGAAGLATSINRDVTAIFAEAEIKLVRAGMQVPLITELAVTPAVRRDNYSDFGASTNPQLGLKWIVSPALLLRGSVGNAFKAPSLAQLYNPPTTFSSTLVDPRRANERYTYSLVSGGNAALKPETGRSYAVGLVLALPQNTGTISVTGWRLEQEERVQILLPTTILANEAVFANRIIRAPPTPAEAAAGTPGRVQQINSISLNFGSALLQGVDASLSHRRPFLGGTLSSSVAIAYTDKYDAALIPGGARENRAGAAVAEGFAPKWKGNVTASWADLTWEVAATVRYIHTYLDYVTVLAPQREVAANTQLDLVASYRTGRTAFHLLNDATISVGVRNALDRDAPYSNADRGYDNLQHNLTGRFAYLKLEKKF